MKKLFFPLLALLFLCGCAPLLPYREVSRLALVQTMGFDAAAAGSRISVCTGPGTEDVPSVRLAASGANIAEAERTAREDAAGKDLFFAHVRFAVLGERAAREGLLPVLDYFERSTEMRPDIPLFIVRGDSAESVVTGSADESYNISSLLNALTERTEHTGGVYPYTLLDLSERLARSGSALCCAIRLTDPSEDAPSAEEGALAVQEAGYAVFRGDALAGYLSESASLGANLLSGRAQGALLTLPLGDSGTVTAELLACGVSLAAETDEAGEPFLTVELAARAGITLASLTGRPPENALAQLNAALARQLRACVKETLESACAFRADFPELHRLFSRADARYAAWTPEELLSRVTVRVNVRAEAERSYDLDGFSAGEEGPAVE